MLENLLTEQRNPASDGIDEQSTEGILRIINQEDEKVAAAIRTVIPKIAQLVEGLVARIRQGGRLFYIGAGSSGRLGVLDAAECPPTYNVSADLVQGIIAGGESALARATESTEDDPETGRRDLLARGFVSGDVLIGIAASGRTPYVLGAVGQARAMKALTAGVSCTPNSELSAAVDIPIELLVGPEVIAGSTRMKAGTATKLALNMISTAVMIRLGYTFGNLMVNVQPKNTKLEDRARRIIAAAAAIVMGRLDLERTSAAAKIAAAGGRIAGALKG